jgi:hypothetical protein
MSEQKNSVKKIVKIMVFILAFSVTGLGGIGIVLFGSTLFFGTIGLITSVTGGAAEFLVGGLSASKGVFDAFESFAKKDAMEKAREKELEQRKTAAREEERLAEQMMSQAAEAAALEAEEAATREEQRLVEQMMAQAAEEAALKAEEAAMLEAEEATAVEEQRPATAKKTIAEARKAAAEAKRAAAEAKKTMPKQEEPKAVAKQEPGKTYKTSFNCNTAKTTAAKTVCTDEELAKMDLEMFKLYKPLMGYFEEDQKNWLRKRNKCEDNIACLKSEYKARIKFLKDNS